jgi:hypothetical protein
MPGRERNSHWSTGWYSFFLMKKSADFSADIQQPSNSLEYKCSTQGCPRIPWKICVVVWVSFQITSDWNQTEGLPEHSFQPGDGPISANLCRDPGRLYAWLINKDLNYTAKVMQWNHGNNSSPSPQGPLALPTTGLSAWVSLSPVSHAQGIVDNGNNDAIPPPTPTASKLTWGQMWDCDSNPPFSRKISNSVADGAEKPNLSYPAICGFSTGHPFHGLWGVN